MVRNITVAMVGAALVALVVFPADAQQMASAPNIIPGQRHLVFMEEGGRLPASAATVLQNAATVAKSQPVTIEGRPAQAAEVKRELIRLGAPGESIIVRPVPAAPIPAPADGLPNPAQRHVAIGY